MLSKKNVLGIEKQAQLIMMSSPQQLKRWKGKRISPVIYHILEDANWHSENSKLSQWGSYGPRRVHKYPTETFYSPKYYAKYGKIFEQYRKKGGRTYTLLDGL